MGKRHDNRWSNLRLCTHRENSVNRINPAKAGTGIIIYAKISIKGKVKCLGSFSTIKAARLAYDKAFWKEIIKKRRGK